MSRRSFGNVRQTASGRWHARYTAPSDHMPRSIGTTFRTKREAQAALASVQADIERGVWVDPKGPKPAECTRTPTLREYVVHFHASRVGKRGGAVKPSTRSLAESELREYILPTFGDTPLDHVTLAAVREWYGRLQDPIHTPHPWKKDENGKAAALSSSTVRQCYSLLKAIMNMALQEELISTNPCRIKGASQNRYPKPEYMSRADANSIIRHLDSDAATLAKLALATGCRLGELLALTWANVNLDAKLIDVRHSAAEVKGQQIITTTKTEETRDIDLDDETVGLLKAHGVDRPCAPTERLFVSAKGLPLRHRQVQAAWRKARDKAGLSFTFHHLRHTHLTLMAYEGKPIQEIMARAGHASFVAAMNYQRLAKRAGRIEGAAA